MRSVDSYKDLGVVVDCKLKFHQHVREVVGKAGGLMNQLLKSTVCRNRHFMVQLFVSHIRPIIDYCSCVWSVGYLGDGRLLEALQRRWTRQISGVEHLDYVSRLKEVGLYSVAGRSLRMDLIKVWKAFNFDVDLGLSAIFERAPYQNTRGHSLKLSIPICRSDVKRRFLGTRCVTEWNALSSQTVESSSLGVFKRLLDRELGDKLFKVL